MRWTTVVWLLSIAICAIATSTFAEEVSESARLSMFARADAGHDIFYVGSPVELEISLINTLVQRHDAEQLARWREDVAQIEAAGGVIPPPRPLPTARAELDIALGESNLDWLDGLTVEVRNVSSGAVLSTSWDSYLVGADETLGGATLGRDPFWVTFDLPAEITTSWDPGQLVLGVSSPRWGEAELPIQIRHPESEQARALVAHNRACRALRHGEIEEALAQALIARDLSDLTSNPEAELVLGLAQERAGQLDAAIANLERYLETLAREERDPCFQADLAENTLVRLRATAREAGK